MIDASIASLRLDYSQSFLLEKDVDPNPITQFQHWFDDVLAAKISEPNAMVVSTIDAQSNPDSRVVLLKSISANGFIFFTNYESAKGNQIDANANVSVLFFWKELERQVRIKGIAAKIAEQDSIAYFNSRPIGSQLGAIASRQSAALANRQELDEKYAALEAKANEHTFVKPDNWGGYEVVPHQIEFWQGRSSRLHDRLQYNLSTDGNWQIVRLSP
jgi:pyridoxamine 5'-phosphate oxidase